MLLWLLGDVVRVQARTGTLLHKIEAEDTAAILEFASGALGILHATTAAYPGYPRRVEISGTEGTVVLEHARIIGTSLRNAPAAIESAAIDENQSGSTAVVSDFRGHQAVLEIFSKPSSKIALPPVVDSKGAAASPSSRAIYRAAKNSGPRRHRLTRKFLDHLLIFRGFQVEFSTSIAVHEVL